MVFTDNRMLALLDTIKLDAASQRWVAAVALISRFSIDQARRTQLLMPFPGDRTHHAQELKVILVQPTVSSMLV